MTFMPLQTWKHREPLCIYSMINSCSFLCKYVQLPPASPRRSRKKAMAADMGPMPKFPHFAAHRSIEEEDLAPVSWFCLFLAYGQSIGKPSVIGYNSGEIYRKAISENLWGPACASACHSGTEPIFPSLHIVRAPHCVLVIE